MATETVINRPAPFVEDIGTKLSEQALALQGVPVVTTSASGLTKAPGETDAGFLARQQAAQAFDVRKQNLAGIAPQVAGQDALQNLAQVKALQGIGSYQPFLQTAGTQAGLAQGLGTMALGQLGTAASTIGGIGTGAQAFQQNVQDFMSPYQSQVIDATLAEFDKNKAIQQQSIKDQAAALGSFQSNLAGQQAQFGQGLQGMQGTDISRLGSLGALNQAQTQAGLDAQREATRMAAYQPQEQLQDYGNLVTGIMGGMAGSGTRTTQAPDPGFLQTALGAAATGAGIYGALK